MKHFFIAVPNFSGSTLIHNLIATSNNVSNLRELDISVNDFIEGNTLDPNSFKCDSKSQLYTPELKSNLLKEENYDWDNIKKIWNERWQRNKNAQIYLQKTPMDIFRVKMMQEKFEDLKWIVAVKDPYAYIESLFRKQLILQVQNPYDDIEMLCNHVIISMQTQLENIDFLGNKCYPMTLENFIENIHIHVKNIRDFTNGIVDINLSKEIWIKGRPSGEIINDNENKIKKLIRHFPDVIEIINKHFNPHERLLNQWGYEIRK